MIDLGLVILDRDMTVLRWNRWMESKSEITRDQIVGSSVYDFFPNLNNPSFKRNCRSVLSFGNTSFLDQKFYHFLFPLKPVSDIEIKFEYMQQDCTMGPVRDENNTIQHLFIAVNDVTRMAAYEQKLIESSWRDALTGVYNRKFFEEKIKEEFDRHKRYSRPLSFIIFDLDFFKRVNDTYGHQCGDLVLKTVSSKISDSIRTTDFIARYGGEEFCCLLPETSLEPTMILAERLRKAVEELEVFYNGLQLHVTVSIGVSTLVPGMKSREQLFKEADEALYRAKESGRNKVVAMETEHS